MAETLSTKGPTVNNPVATVHEGANDAKPVYHARKVDEHDDLIFGALDDENDLNEHLNKIIPESSNVEHIQTLRTSADDEWQHILPITESDQSIHYPLLTHEKTPSEQIIGMSNFRAKHRFRHHSKSSTLVRWKTITRKAAHLKDPW